MDNFKSPKSIDEMWESLNNPSKKQPTDSFLHKTDESSVSIGAIPDSEVVNASNWQEVFNALGIVINNLDPRPSHKDNKPYDPIDLAFRIAKSVDALRSIRNRIREQNNFPVNFDF